jgi:hypothetical protein
MDSIGTEKHPGSKKPISLACLRHTNDSSDVAFHDPLEPHAVENRAPGLLSPFQQKPVQVVSPQGHAPGMFFSGSLKPCSTLEPLVIVYVDPLDGEPVALAPWPADLQGLQQVKSARSKEVSTDLVVSLGILLQDVDPASLPGGEDSCRTTSGTPSNDQHVRVKDR